MNPPAVEVVVVTRVLGSGGAERQALLLAGALTGSGVPTAVLTFRSDSAVQRPDGVAVLTPVDLTVPEDRRPNGGPVARGRRRIATLLRRWGRRPAESAVRIAARLRIRAVDTFAARLALATFADQGRVIRQAVDRTGARTVVTFLPSMNGAAAAGLWSSPVRLVASERSDPTKGALKSQWAAMRHLVARRADVLGANSEHAARWLFDTFRPDRMTAPLVTPNIVERVSTTAAPDRTVFVVVARLIAGKGVDHVIRAFAAVTDQLPGWDLTVVGDGPDRPRLQHIVSVLGLEARTRFLGEVGRVDTVLSAGGVLVHVSEREGMPNSVMEAMANGLPCIVGDASPGPVELVTGGAQPPAGMIVTGSDPEELSAAMRRVASDRSLRDAYGRAGMERMRQRTWGYLAPTWLALVNASRADERTHPRR